MGRRALILTVTLAFGCGHVAAPSAADRADAGQACSGDPDVMAARPALFDTAWAEEDGVCFSGSPPAPDAYVADVPGPLASQCPEFPAPVCLDGSPVPPGLAGLDIVLPQDSSATEASPWLGIYEGSQGFAHVFLSLRALLPAPVQATRMVRARAWLCVDGRVIGVEDRLTLMRVTPDGAYVDGDADLAALQLVIPTIPSIALGYCGSWATVRLQVVDMASGAWGQAEVPVRLYAEPFPLPHP